MDGNTRKCVIANYTSFTQPMAIGKGLLFELTICDVTASFFSRGKRKSGKTKLSLRNKYKGQHFRMCDNLNTEMYPDFRTKAESDIYVQH